MWVARMVQFVGAAIALKIGNVDPQWSHIKLVQRNRESTRPCGRERNLDWTMKSVHLFGDDFNLVNALRFIGLF